MREHVLIRIMITVVEKELEKPSDQNLIEPCFIETLVDFFKTYADRCHHGKGEDILFRDLSMKQLSEEHRKIINDLVKFYPLHIEKEDKHFFYPLMEYFTQQELDVMLQEF